MVLGEGMFLVLEGGVVGWPQAFNPATMSMKLQVHPRSREAEMKKGRKEGSIR
jgi:hypothetical protein